jgi:ribosome-associated protein
MNNPDTIDLDQFLKTCGVATGGQAKLKIQSGQVKVNGEVELRRRRKLKVGDEVSFDGEVYQVVFDEGDEGDEGDDEGNSIVQER